MKKVVEYLPFVGIVLATCAAAVLAGREPGARAATGLPGQGRYARAAGKALRPRRR